MGTSILYWCLEFLALAIAKEHNSFSLNLFMSQVLLIIIKGRTFLVMLRFVGRGRGEFTTSVFIYFCVQDDAWVALHFIVLPSLCRDLDDPGTFMDLSVSNAHE